MLRKLVGQVHWRRAEGAPHFLALAAEGAPHFLDLLGKCGNICLGGEPPVFVPFGLEKGKLMSDFNTVVLPSKSYTQYAFAGAEYIQHLVFIGGEDDLVVTFGSFSDLPNLETITFQCGVESIAYDCFCRCPKLHTVKFEQPVEQIVSSFNENPQLSQLVWPERSEEAIEQNVGGWRQPKPKPLIGSIDGFNGCSKLSFDQIPLERAEAIGGFSHNYRNAVTIMSAAPNQKPESAGTATMIYQTTRSGCDRMLADTMACAERTAAGTMLLASRLASSAIL